MALTKVKGSILSDELYRRENNLSDVLDKARARTNLGVYSTTDSDNRFLNESSNLSDLDNKETARANLDVFSKSEINSELDKMPPSIWAGELRRFSFDTPPAGFFALDGSTITNGKNDYTALVNSGSRFIMVSGNNIVLKNAADFGRGKGSSGRAIGYSEGDTIREITGQLTSMRAQNDFTASGAFSSSSPGNFNSSSQAVYSKRQNVTFSASRVVPTSSENRPKSITELVCIYHGVI